MSDEGFDFGAAFENFDIDVGDDGEIQVFSTSTDDDVEGDEQGSELDGELDSDATDGDEPDAEGSTDEEVASGSDSDSATIAELKATIERLTAQVEEAAQNIADGEEVTEQQLDELNNLFGETPDDEWDINEAFGSKKDAEKLIADAVNRIVNNRLEPFREVLSEHQAKQEVQYMARTYGEEFGRAIPLIKEIITKRPELDLETAFSLAKTVGIPEAPEEPAVESQKVQANPSSVEASDDGRTADKLLQRAEKLRTEKGVSGNKQDKSGHSTTVEGALEAALEEHGLA